MLLRMKKSWMKMQPKGRMPPMIIAGMVRVWMLWLGIWRGIWLVRTGCACGGGVEECQARRAEVQKKVAAAGDGLASDAASDAPTCSIAGFLKPE